MCYNQDDVFIFYALGLTLICKIKIIEYITFRCKNPSMLNYIYLKTARVGNRVCFQQMRVRLIYRGGLPILKIVTFFQ